MANVLQLDKLFLRLVDPVKYRALSHDFQIGWFWKLLTKMIYMVPPGRVPYDGNLWKLSGARSRQNWDAFSGPVINCFRVSRIGNAEWLVHEELIRVIEELKMLSEIKETKDSYVISTDEIEPLGILFISFYKNYPRKIQKKAAKKAFLKACKEHSRETKAPVLDSAEFISHRSAEFAAATKRAQTEKKFVPYPATWLNKGGFMDDPSEWVVNATVEKASKSEQNLRANLEIADGLFGATLERDAGEIPASGDTAGKPGSIFGRLAQEGRAGGPRTVHGGSGASAGKVKVFPSHSGH